MVSEKLYDASLDDTEHLTQAAVGMKPLLEDVAKAFDILL